MKNTKKEEKIILERTYKRDSENRIIIDMNVKDDTDFLSVYSETETPVVNSSVAEFIENSTISIPENEQITLKIKSDCITKKEMPIYEKAIKEYYREKYIINQEEIKKNNFISIIFTLISLLFLAIATIVKTDIFMSFEVINIFAWFFLWEAIDVAFLRTRQLRANKKRFLAFISMKIEFTSNKLGNN